MNNETRQQLIQRLIDANDARDAEVAAEAQRYEDKQMDEPAPRCIRFKYMIEDLVYFKIGDPLIFGIITDVYLHPLGVVYQVAWADTRTASSHYEFELMPVPNDDVETEG
jgi:hypothetical protein